MSRRIFKMFRFAQHDNKGHRHPECPFSVILRDVSPEESLRCFAPLNMTVQCTVILSAYLPVILSEAKDL